MGCAGPSHLLAGRFPGGRPPGGQTGPDPAQARIRGRGVTARLHKTLPAPNALTEVRPHTSAEWRTAGFRSADHWRHRQNNHSGGRQQRTLSSRYLRYSAAVRCDPSAAGDCAATADLGPAPATSRPVPCPPAPTTSRPVSCPPAPLTSLSRPLPTAAPSPCPAQLPHPLTPARSLARPPCGKPPRTYPRFRANFSPITLGHQR